MWLRIMLIVCVGATAIMGMRAGAGPFDSVLSGRALQKQRESDFLASSIRYLTEEERCDEAEWSRVMNILTSGGFSSEQLASAVYGLTAPPGIPAIMDRETLVARAAIVRRLLAHVREITPPLRRDEVTMMRVEGVGLFIEIGDRSYSGEEAAAIHRQVNHRLEITATWDAIERRLHELEQAIADLHGSGD